MGLRETIQKAVKTGLEATGNIRQTSTYNVAGTPTYNPTTGTGTNPTTAYSCKAIFASFDKREIDGDVIKPEDQKVLMAPHYIPGITPTLNDTIVDEAGVTWQVQGAQKDPTTSIWVLQVRRP